MLLNCIVNCSPIRSVILMSFARVASTFHRGKPLRLPTPPPQLVSMPKTHRRNELKTAAGSANMFMPSGLVVPIPFEPRTPRLAVGLMLTGAMGIADSKPLAPPLEFPVSPKAWQSAPHPPAPAQLILVGEPLCAAKNGEIDQPFNRWPFQPCWLLKKSGR